MTAVKFFPGGFGKHLPRLLLQSCLIVLVVLAVEIAFLCVPGTADVIRWLLYMDVARQKGVLALYSIAVNTGVDTHDPSIIQVYTTYFNTANFATILKVFGANHVVAEIGGSQTDYPPLGISILGLTSKFSDLLSVSDFLTLKFSIVIFTVASALLAALWRGSSFGLGTATFLVLAFEGSFGYLDAYFILFILLSLHCFDCGRDAAGGAFYALACFAKWQPILLAPLVVILAWRAGPWRAFLIKLLPAAMVMAVMFAVFGNAPLIAFFHGVDTGALSDQGLNLNYLIQAAIETHAGTLVEGLVHTVAVPSNYGDVRWYSIALALVLYGLFASKFYRSSRSIDDFIEASIGCYISYFMFFTSVHENHALLPAILGLYWAAIKPEHFFDAVYLVLICLLSLYIFYGSSGLAPSYSRLLFTGIIGIDPTVLLAGLNLIYMIIFILNQLALPFLRQRSHSAASPSM